MRTLSWISILLAGLVAPALTFGLAEESRSADKERRIDRILELRRELQELLEDLPPEARQEVERRWRRERGLEPMAPAETGAGRPESVVKPEPEIVPEPSAPAVVARPTPSSEPTVAAPACGTLAVLDSNGDGAITAADRYWRYLSLWKDDGDGVIEESELRSLYRHGIRRVSSRLYSYTTAKGVEGGVWVEDSIYFDLPGRGSPAVLAINAGALARGDDLRLEDRAGVAQQGFQELRSELDWVLRGTERVSVLCRRASAD